MEGKASLDAWNFITGNVLRVHQAKGIDLPASTAKQQNTPNVEAAPSAKLTSDLNVIISPTDHHAPTSKKRESHSILLDRRRRLVRLWIDTQRDRASELRGDVGLIPEESRMSVGSDVEMGRELGSALSVLDVAERAVTRPSGTKGDIVVNSQPTGECLASLRRCS